MSREGREYMEQAPWLAFWPGIFLTVLVYSLNMFGDAVRKPARPEAEGRRRPLRPRAGEKGLAWSRSRLSRNEFMVGYAPLSAWFSTNNATSASIAWASICCAPLISPL